MRTNRPPHTARISSLCRGICFFLLLLTVVGCRPRGVLSTREMRDVLYDLHRTDGAVQIAGYNYSHDAELAACYKAVLDKHGITQAQFDSSLVWYTDNPQIFNKVYPRVVTRLEADLRQQESLRDAVRQENTLSPVIEEEPANIVPFEQLQHIYIHGQDNPWHIWSPDTFRTTDIIIFGDSVFFTAMNCDTVDTLQAMPQCVEAL